MSPRRSQRSGRDLVELRQGMVSWAGDLRVGLVTVDGSSAAMQVFGHLEQGYELIEGPVGTTFTVAGQDLTVHGIERDENGFFVMLDVRRG